MGVPSLVMRRVLSHWEGAAGVLVVGVVAGLEAFGAFLDTTFARVAWGEVGVVDGAGVLGGALVAPGRRGGPWGASGGCWRFGELEGMQEDLLL